MNDVRRRPTQRTPDGPTSVDPPGEMEAQRRKVAMPEGFQALALMRLAATMSTQLITTSSARIISVLVIGVLGS